MSALLETAWEVINEVSIFDDPSTQMQQLQHALSLLREAESSEPTNAEVQYAIGYCWYLWPKKNSARNSAVRSSLTKALEFNPQHRWARLYLGHFFYDSGDFRGALDQIQILDLSHFESIGQVWRAAKATELVLACKIRLGEVENFTASMMAFAQKYGGYSLEDLSPPAELISSLVAVERGAVGAHKTPDLAQILKLLQKIVAASGSQELFTDELEFLRSSRAQD